MRWWRGTNRQVTLIASEAFVGTSFAYCESRRNIITKDVELMWLVGRTFKIGTATFYGVKYCDPCNRPNKLCGKPQSFKDEFLDRGGLVAEVIEGGIIKEGDAIILPSKGY
jgi:MOSC domain-containing protein YiiM